MPALARLTILHHFAILRANLGVEALVPKLRKLQAAAVMLLSDEVEPCIIHLDLSIDQELCHHRSFGQFPQVVNHTLSLRDQVKVAGECICIPDHGVVLSSDRRILHAMSSDELLP